MRDRRLVTGLLALVLTLSLAATAAAQLRIDDGASSPGGTPTAEVARANMLAFTETLGTLTSGIEVPYYQRRLQVLRAQIAGLGSADLEAILRALQGVPDWCCAIEEMHGCGATAMSAAPGGGPPTDAASRHALLDAWNAAEVASLIADGSCHSAHDGDGDDSNGGLCPGAFVLKGMAWVARFAYEQSTFAHREAFDQRITALLDRLEAGATLVPAPDAVDGVAATPARAGEPRFARPFPNPSTGVIAFDVVLPEAAAASLRVYDVAGALVDVVADGPLAAGHHAFAWDPARVRSGLAPGVYFARFDVGARRLLQRVIVSR